MAKHTLESKFFEYGQNNSGGSFDIDDGRGIGVKVWIEAFSADDADRRAEAIGIYFDGCSKGMDCDCCGDRWSTTWGDGEAAPTINNDYDFTWHHTVYVHKLDGSIERISVPKQ